MFETTKKNREKLVDLMLNKMNVPGIFIINSAILPLFGFGLPTGTVIDIESENIQIIAVINGAVSRTSIQWNVGHIDVIKHFKKIAHLEKYSDEDVEIIMSTCCYVSLDYDDEIEEYENSKEKNKIYKYHDDTIFEFNKERIECYEFLFQPELNKDIEPIKQGSKCLGIQDLLFNTLIKIYEEKRKDVLSNIIVNIHVPMYKNFVKRLQNEIDKKKTILLSDPNIVQLENRTDLTWIGANVLCKLLDSSDTWIDKDALKQRGKDVVHEVFI